jgi:large subunit ribosomal protein L3
MVEPAAEHEVHPEVSPELQEKLLHEQQAGAGDDITPAVGDENNAAEGNAPEADENKEG